MTVQEQIAKFEQLQKEIAVLAMLGKEPFESEAKRIYAQLEALNLNPKGRPTLTLIQGGVKST